MAAAVKALNAKIRSNTVLDYVCSTHFWGPVSNFGIPVAAVLDTQKDADLISGRMTGALTLYSATFMRYSLAVTPKNYLLFACHAVNFGAQVTQGVRFLQYWNYGGREAQLQARAQEGLKSAEGETKGLLAEAEQKGKGLVDEATRKAAEVKDKVTR